MSKAVKVKGTIYLVLAALVGALAGLTGLDLLVDAVVRWRKR
jgi:hypothetical protein